MSLLPHVRSKGAAIGKCARTINTLQCVNLGLEAEIKRKNERKNERERERERVCVCVCERESVCV